MLSAARVRKIRSFFVFAAALYLGAFAIYLKASAVEPVHAATSTVKIWTDPDNKAFDYKINASAAPFLLSVLLSTLALIMPEGWTFILVAASFPRPRLFRQSPNWLRPPPIFAQS